MLTPSGAPAQFRFWNRPCKVEWPLARKDCLDPQRFKTVVLPYHCYYSLSGAKIHISNGNARD